MIVERMIHILHLKSYWVRLILGAAIIAFIISLGLIIIPGLLGFKIDNGIIAAFTAIGTAIYAMRVRRH
jgi:hypothetical protein